MNQVVCVAAVVGVVVTLIIILIPGAASATREIAFDAPD